MQFRVTLSTNDPIESRICAEASPLNARRRGEYLRRLLLRGFMAEREDIAKLGGFDAASLSRTGDSAHDYNGFNSTGANAGRPDAGGSLGASSLKGIFADQPRTDDATKGGVK